MRNEYDIVGFDKSEVGSFAYNWLGAPVSFVLFGKRRKGRVTAACDMDKTLKATLTECPFCLVVEGSYQAFRKEKP